MSRSSTVRSVPPEGEDVRTGTSVAAIRESVLDNLYYLLAEEPDSASAHDWYTALAYAIRDRMLGRYMQRISALAGREASGKSVAYLSAEFLTGPHLGNGLLNLGIEAEARAAVAQLGQDLDRLLEEEEEPGLGNGGLGRLAACFMDSLATLATPAIGYGIRYEFGIFDQAIRDGWQVELTDKWLRRGNPWEILRPEIDIAVGFGGHAEHHNDEHGRLRVRWLPAFIVRGVAFDTPVAGYRTPHTNFLRLWKAEATESFDFEDFNAGDYVGAVHEKVASETISKVLYPNDQAMAGKQLRLAQQYFFVSCSLQDMLHMHFDVHGTLTNLDTHWAVQLNDTHPAIAVAELMRLLVDEHCLEWDAAWEVTQRTLAFTNHTLLPEALERWGIPLFGSLLPRHLEIVYEINRRFLDEIRARFPGDEQRVAALSLIDETAPRYVRMANLASVGSHAINGVSTLHSELLRETVLRPFYDVYPERFLSVTNGVTPRRWLALANPRLRALISERIGDAWIGDMEHEIERLEPFAADGDFRERWRAVKRANKEQLAKIVASRTGVALNPDAIFDVQVKRIHEYKRQHLNALHVVTLYLRLLRDPGAAAPRAVIFAGKAAPGYEMAKLVIKLINCVAEVVNRDRTIGDALKVVFVPDFNVKTAQHIYPAADLSQQISTAGHEAAGTGNMKFAMNGALTIGTLDGANVEIRSAVGEQNFFEFGLTAEQVLERRAQGYRPRALYDANSELRETIDLIASGHFSRGDKELFRPLVDALLERDYYLLLADYQSYVERQSTVAEAYGDIEQWNRMAILNVARSGWFSSDRAIRDYSAKIWGCSAPSRG